MSKYGYVGKESDIPQQAFGANAGVLSVNDHLALSQEDKLSQFGQLELIETQTVSSVSAITFSNLQDYNIHLFTFNDIHHNQDNTDLFSRALVNGQEDSGSSNYGRAHQAMAPSYFYQDRDPDLHSLRHIPEIGNATNETLNGWLYMYGANDGGSYTFFNQMFTGIKYDGKTLSNYGYGVYEMKNILSGIKFYTSGTSNFPSGTVSLYGIKEY
tara:strand:- start:1648 stop:2286 length:639 start_codon:yes stop_codon:yes gene_type:complete